MDFSPSRRPSLEAMAADAARNFRRGPFVNSRRRKTLKLPDVLSRKALTKLDKT
jgi:hypothetical protein